MNFFLSLSIKKLEIKAPAQWEFLFVVLFAKELKFFSSTNELCSSLHAISNYISIFDCVESLHSSERLVCQLTLDSGSATSLVDSCRSGMLFVFPRHNHICMQNLSIALFEFVLDLCTRASKRVSQSQIRR